MSIEANPSATLLPAYTVDFSAWDDAVIAATNFGLGFSVEPRYGLTQLRSGCCGSSFIASTVAGRSLCEACYQYVPDRPPRLSANFKDQGLPLYWVEHYAGIFASDLVHARLVHLTAKAVAILDSGTSRWDRAHSNPIRALAKLSGVLL